MNLKVKITLLITSLFLSCFLFSQDNKSRKYLVEGNKKYLGLSYDEAAANYLRAIQEGKDSYKSNFNLGNAMYRLKKYDDAISQYEKSSKFAANKLEEFNANFNIGDCYYKKKEYNKAAEAFKKALKLNPRDEKARYNYALVKQKLKEIEEKYKKDSKNQQEQKQKNQQNSEKKDEPSQPQDLQPKSQENKEKNQQGQSGGKGEEKSGQGSGKEKGQRIENDNIKNNEEISTKSGEGQYYEGILGAMKEQEKRAQQKIINKRKPPSQNQGGKDW